jgi:LPXTG-site transpeptidase (sortase) family protein
VIASRRLRMTRSPGGPPRRVPAAPALLTVAVLADVALLAVTGASFAAQAAPPPVARSRAPSPPPAAAAAASARGLQDPAEPSLVRRTTAVPRRILIPTIGVDAPIQRLERDAKGVLQPPTEWASAGWYAGGVVPGDTGPAIIAGHLDTTRRAAVFVALRALRPGDRIVVRMSDSRTVRFTVTGAKVVAKALFPTSAVYGPTPDAELRLITCSEPFDEARGAYADNLVVFAAEG